MLSLKKDGTYLLACSFGPDSMALLNMLIEENIHPIVCHVNYHRRPESDLEQSGLEQFCLSHNLELNVLDTKGLKPTGNFQAWARNVRYRFFKGLYKEYKADALLIAHHEDDLIETFLLQKARKSLLLSYGLALKSDNFGMTVLRPLLSFSKSSLLTYCEKNNVPFSIDSSNLTDHYERNRIRHSLVEKMTPSERLDVLDEIQHKNDENQNILTQLKVMFPSFDQVSISGVNTLSLEAFIILLYLMLKEKKIYFPLTLDHVHQVRDLCRSHKPNSAIPLGDKWQFERQYDLLFLSSPLHIEPYRFVLQAPGPLFCSYFKVDFSVGYLGQNIALEQYPITVRPAIKGDTVYVGQRIKRLNRLFIEWKLPMRLRKIWPVVVDKNDHLIYVPRYQKDPGFPPQSNFVINESFDYVH